MMLSGFYTQIQCTKEISLQFQVNQDLLGHDIHTSCDTWSLTCGCVHENAKRLQHLLAVQSTEKLIPQSALLPAAHGV